jgi:hypothetical protein
MLMKENEIESEIYRLFRIKNNEIIEKHINEEHTLLITLQNKHKLKSSACPNEIRKLYRNQLNTTIELFLDSTIEVIENDRLIPDSIITISIGIITKFINNEFDRKKTDYEKILQKIGALHDSFLSVFETEKDLLIDYSKDKLIFRIKEVNKAITTKINDRRFNFRKDLIIAIISGLIGGIFGQELRNFISLIVKTITN